jgi:hypothetical protein
MEPSNSLTQFLLHISNLQKTGVISPEEKGVLKDRALAGEQAHKFHSAEFPSLTWFQAVIEQGMRLNSHDDVENLMNRLSIHPQPSSEIPPAVSSPTPPPNFSPITSDVVQVGSHTGGPTLTKPVTERSKKHISYAPYIFAGTETLVIVVLSYISLIFM